MRKILFDTDIGTDVDDAVTLAYLLTQPECELLGITTVTGEPHKRAEIASAICHAGGKKVPIFPGADRPLINPEKQPWAAQALALDQFPHETIEPRPALEAIQFLHTTIEAHPGEVDLLATGPLTNLALLFSLDPGIARKLNSLTLMIGNFPEASDQNSGQDSSQAGDQASDQAKDRDWNSRLDPHAAAIVYQTPVNTHRSIGKNITEQVRMQADEVRYTFRGGLLELVRRLAEYWFQEQNGLTFNDPLAAAVLFDDKICEFTPGTVFVELNDPEKMGKAIWHPVRKGVRHEVAVQVNPGRFFEHFFGVFKGSQ